MLKIVVDDESLLEEMSENLTDCCMTEPCSNCAVVKRAVKNNDIEEFMHLTNYDEKEASEEINVCKRCMWYYIDEVDYV